MGWLDDYFLPEPTTPIDVAGSGTLNNVPTVDMSGKPVSCIRFTGAPTVTGLVPARAGQRIHCIAAGGPLVLPSDSLLSAVGNRIRLGSLDVTIPQEYSAWLVHDDVANLWRIASNGALAIPVGQRLDEPILSYNGAPTPGASPLAGGPRIIASSSFDDGAPMTDGVVSTQIYATFTTSTSVQPVFYVPSVGLDAGWGVACDFNVVARDSAGNLGRAKVTGCYRRIGSAIPTVVGSPTIGAWEGTSGGTLSFSNSGTTLVLNAAPANATRRLWSVQAMLTFLPPVAA